MMLQVALETATGRRVAGDLGAALDPHRQVIEMGLARDLEQVVGSEV